MPSNVGAEMPVPLQNTDAPATRCGLAVNASDAAADAAETVPLASLLTANIIPQGEIVNLLLKPSRWFILLNALRFAAIVVVVVAVLNVAGAQSLLSRAGWVQLAVFLIAGRILWSLVQWMGRFYVLTDMRVLRVCGVFDVQIDSRMLREIDDVKFYPSPTERMLGLGSLDIFSGVQKPMTWQTVSEPNNVLLQIQAAVNRAKHNGLGTGNAL